MIPRPSSYLLVYAVNFSILTGRSNRPSTVRGLISIFNQRCYQQLLKENSMEYLLTQAPCLKDIRGQKELFTDADRCLIGNDFFS